MRLAQVQTTVHSRSNQRLLTVPMSAAQDANILNNCFSNISKLKSKFTQNAKTHPRLHSQLQFAQRHKHASLELRVSYSVLF
jgi:hypothetical protein